MTPDALGCTPLASWDGAILCGGASRRMGRDKALLEIDGAPMVLRVGRALEQAGAARVLVVGGDRAALEAALSALSVPVAFVGDERPGQGPLGGLVTALAGASSPVVLVVPCDLVAPSAEAMRTTVARLRDDPTAHLAAVATDPGRTPGTGQARGRPPVQWLHGAWRRHAEQPLRARFDAGERAIHRAVAGSGLTVLPVTGIAPRAVADADTPADLRDRRP